MFRTCLLAKVFSASGVGVCGVTLGTWIHVCVTLPDSNIDESKNIVVVHTYSQSLYYCFTLKARAIILRRLLRRHTHYYDCVVRCMLRHHTHYYALIVGVLRRNELWLYLAWKPSRAFEGDVSYYLPGALLLFDLRCMLRIWFPQICVFVHFDL